MILRFTVDEIGNGIFFNDRAPGLPAIRSGAVTTHLRTLRVKIHPTLDLFLRPRHVVGLDLPEHVDEGSLVRNFLADLGGLPDVIVRKLADRCGGVFPAHVVNDTIRNANFVGGELGELRLFESNVLLLAVAVVLRLPRGNRTFTFKLGNDFLDVLRDGAVLEFDVRLPRHRRTGIQIRLKVGVKQNLVQLRLAELRRVSDLVADIMDQLL